MKISSVLTFLLSTAVAVTAVTETKERLLGGNLQEFNGLYTAIDPRDGGVFTISIYNGVFDLTDTWATTCDEEGSDSQSQGGFGSDVIKKINNNAFEVDLIFKCRAQDKEVPFSLTFRRARGAKNTWIANQPLVGGDVIVYKVGPVGI